MQVAPGETALAFYTAKNPSDKAIIGISTYNVVPFEAGQYFNKIQVGIFPNISVFEKKLAFSNYVLSNRWKRSREQIKIKAFSVTMLR